MYNAIVSLRRLIWSRLLAASSVAVVLLATRLTPPGDALPLPQGQWLLYAVVGSVFPLTFLYLIWRRFGRDLERQAYFQLAVDIVLISLLVLHFGLRSAFSVLYFPVVVAAAALVSRKAAFALAAFASFLYSGLVISFYNGWLRAAGTPDQAEDLFLVVYKITAHVVGLFLVAFLMSTLVSRSETVAGRLAYAERRYQRLEDLYRNVFESIETGVITTDLEGRISSANRAACALFGITDRPQNQPTKAFRDRFPEEIVNFLTAPVSDVRSQQLEVSIRGESRILAVAARPLARADGVAVGRCITIADITEERRLEAELRLKERMAAAGELAAGLAHEVGNPLAALAGSAQLLEDSGSHSSGELRLLGVIRREASRLDRTIKNFLSFARGGEPVVEEFDLAELVRECSHLLRNSPEFLHDHRLTLRGAEELHPIVADRDQMAQIFWNLTQNGLRAMPDGGVLEVEMASNADVVSLKVIDHGKGIDPQDKERLLTPFQSGFKGGAGIGLSIIYRIVEEHGGNITLTDVPGGGTCAEVEFPSAAVQRAASS